MKIEHLTNSGIKINGDFINWDAPRSQVREILRGNYKALNVVLSLKEFDPEADDLIQRKDIYQNYLGSDTWFAIVYSEDDRFEAFELHGGDEIRINESISLKFGENIFEALGRLETEEESIFYMDEEDILLTDFKTSFSSADHLGGDGKDVEYICCFKSIRHLISP